MTATSSKGKNPDKDKEPENVEIGEVKLPQGVKELDLSQVVERFPPKNIISTEKPIKIMDMRYIHHLAYQLAGLYGVTQVTTSMGIIEFIRKGAASNNTPPFLKVEIRCPDEDCVMVMTKEAVVSNLAFITNKKHNIKDVANTLAPIIIQYGLNKSKENPTQDYSGDLTKKVNARRVYRKHTPLTPKEPIGCASYAQNLPNLDQLVESDRLSSLLAEDLELRRKANIERNMANPKGEKKGKKNKWQLKNPEGKKGKNDKK